MHTDALLPTASKTCVLHLVHMAGHRAEEAVAAHAEAKDGKVAAKDGKVSKDARLGTGEMEMEAWKARAELQALLEKVSCMNVNQ